MVTESGFQDIVFQAGICSSGSLLGVLSGSHYNTLREEILADRKSLRNLAEFNLADHAKIKFLREFILADRKKHFCRSILTK